MRRIWNVNEKNLLNKIYEFIERVQNFYKSYCLPNNMTTIFHSENYYVILKVVSKIYKISVMYILK